MSLFSRLLKRSVTDFLRKRRRWIIAFSLLFFFAFGISVYFAKQAGHALSTLMTDFVREKSNGFYQIEFDDIDFLINSRTFRVNDLRFLQTHVFSDQDDFLKDVNYLYSAEIPELRIKVIDFWSIFILKKLRVAGIELGQPTVKITNLNKTRAPKKISFEAGNLYGIISGHLAELRINDFNIIGGNLIYETMDAPEYDNFHINGLVFKVRNFLLNESASRDDGKFLYTDDITLELGKQLFLLKDSIHNIEFDRFYISTRANELIFDNFKLTRRDDIPQSAKHDDYTIMLPRFHLSGIDFLSAYHSNHLIIDSIRIPTPVVDLKLETGKKHKKAEKSGLLDLILMYHEKLYIGDLQMHDAKVKIAGATNGKQLSIQTGQINAGISEIRLDQDIRSQHHYGFAFDQIDLQIKNYQTDLPDSSASIRIGEIDIISAPLLTYSIRDLEFFTRQKPGNGNQIHAKVPFIVLSDFDLQRYINSDTIIFKELYIEQPEIIMAVADARGTTAGSQTTGGFFGIYKTIHSFSSLFDGKKVLLQDGSFTLKHSLQNIEATLGQIRFQLDNLYVDSLTANSRDFFSGVRLSAAVGRGKLGSNELAVELENLGFSSVNKDMTIGSLALQSTRGEHGGPDNFSFSDVRIRGINVDEIVKGEKYDLDAVHVRQGDLRIFRIQKDSTQLSKPTPEQTLTTPVNVRQIKIENTRLEYRLKDYWVFKASDAELDVSGLSYDRLRGENISDWFDFQKIHQIRLNDYSFLMEKQKHLLEMNGVGFSPNGVMEIDSLKLSPIGVPSNQYKIRVPRIYATGMDVKKIIRESYYSGEDIIIERPEIELRTTTDTTKKISSLDLNYIPLLMRKGFYGAKTNSFQLIDARLKIHAESENGSSTMECDMLNADIIDFEVDSSMLMVPDRFLFSHNVKINGDYFSYYQPKQGNFFGINHFDISTRDKNVFLEGMLLATNNRQSMETAGKINLSLDHLNFTGLDFYALTQNRDLKIEDIDIVDASLKISPVPPPIDTAGINKPLTAKELLLNEIGKALHPADSDRFDLNRGKSQKKLLKLHELDYPLDTMLIKNVDVGRLRITDSEVSINNELKARKDLTLTDIRILAEGIKYNPVTARDSTRILYSDHLVTKLSNLSYVLPDKFNAIMAKELVFNSADSSLLLKNFTFDPLLPKYKYANEKGFQATWMRIDTDFIKLQGTDFFHLLNAGALNAKSIRLHKSDFEIYRDNRLPFPEWQRKPLPQTELKNLAFDVTVDSLFLTDSYITYQEQTDKADYPGEISFYNLNATILNLTNDSLRISMRPKTNVTATTRLYNKTPVKALFQFDMLKPELVHTYGVEVDSVDLTDFNRILVPVAMTQIKSGQSKRIMMTASANETYSYGEMRFFYNDLKIQLLNPETETPKGIGNVLGSFFANTFIIRTNNPRNFVFRKGDIFYERDEKRAIFNYWTKTFLSGVVSSIGAANNKKKIRKMQKQNLKEIEQRKNQIQ